MRYLLFDKTCPRLSIAWRAGAQLYRRLGRIDEARGIASWDEGLAWLASRDAITELQYWGHGKWGAALVDGTDIFDRTALAPGHALHRHLEAIRERLAPAKSISRDSGSATPPLIWFRTCETFGAHRGLDFAESLADWTGSRVAGHTHVIGFHQSGGHALAAGTRATWSPDEGLVAGTADAPERARSSAPWRANTITCLAGKVPDTWFAR